MKCSEVSQRKREAREFVKQWGRDGGTLREAVAVFAREFGVHVTTARTYIGAAERWTGVYLKRTNPGSPKRQPITPEQ